MKNKDRVEFCIDAEAYEEIINNIRFKAPLEAGVEVAVFMLLYGILDINKYDLMDVSTMTKSNFLVYLLEGSKESAQLNPKTKKKEADKTTDLVITGKGFRYNSGVVNEDNITGAYAFIEVKKLATKEIKTEWDIQKKNINHFIWTNGIKWIFCHKNKEPQTLDLDKRKRFPKQYYVDKDKFKELLTMLSSIEWEKNEEV